MPRSYRTMYRTDPQIIVQCHNRATGPHVPSGQCVASFFLQGTGYSESSNSDYPLVINQRKVSIYLIPQEMRGALGRRVEEQRQSLRSLNRNTAVKLFATGTFVDQNDSYSFAMHITDYPGKNYHDRLFTPSLKWLIFMHTLHPLLELTGRSRGTDASCLLCTGMTVQKIVPTLGK